MKEIDYLTYIYFIVIISLLFCIKACLPMVSVFTLVHKAAARGVTRDSQVDRCVPFHVSSRYQTTIISYK